MQYLGWMDDSKRPIAEKIEAGRKAYHDRFGEAPRVVLVSEAEAEQAIAVQNIIILFKSYIRKHNFWFGQSDC